MTAPPRLPPSNRSAEEALLGAMLLNREARKVGLDVASTDFYYAKLAMIHEAIAVAVAEGRGVDPVTIAETLRAQGRLDDVGGKPEILRIQAQTPASLNAPHYARIVLELAACRRAIHVAEDLSTLGWEGSVEGVNDYIEKIPAHVRAQTVTPQKPSDILELHDDEKSEFVIPGLLRRRERVIVTGGEGAGKSHLGRWLAMSVAAGAQPFMEGETFEPRPTLIVDLENEKGDIGDAARRMARVLPYKGGCHAESRSQGIDLTTSGDVRWLSGLLAGVRPAIVVIGPLYKMYRGAEHRSKASEEAAEIVSATLDDLRVEYDCALWVEAHSPHGNQNDRDGGRPRGSALWLGWPNFGRYMERQPHDPKLVRLRPWRGDRHRGRRWPWGLREGHTRPWIAVWDGEGR